MDFNFYSNLKKTFFISAIALSNYAIADSSMFQNTNPYKNYSYTPPTSKLLLLFTLILFELKLDSTFAIAINSQGSSDYFLAAASHQRRVARP